MFILTILIAYLMIGAVLARRDYAKRALTEAQRDLAAELLTRRTALKNLKHARNCWVGGAYGNNHGHSCDCAHKDTYAMLRREVVSLEAGEIAVGSPYPMFLAWPAMSLHAFLTTGKVKESPALRSKDWEAKMERELFELDS